MSETSPVWQAQPHGPRWPRLAEAWGSPRHGLPLEEASDRRLSPLVPDTGAGHRTHPLVNAMAGHATRTTYSPTDISPSALEENRRYFEAACGATAGLRFEPLVGTHQATTHAAAEAQRGGGGGGVTTFMFMGSSLGNYFDAEIVGLLRLILGE